MTFKDNYSVKNSLKKLFLQRYERYLPTAFDESMSILEKMNKLIEAQNALIDVVNAHTEFTSKQLERAFGIIDENLAKQLKQFRDELEEQKTLYEEIRDKIHSDLLPDSVKQKLEEWLLNGTIEELINDVIFGDMIEKLEMVENRIESLSYSILDFGGAGDGVSNNNSAFREAIDYLSSRGGGQLKIPEGEFYLTQTIRVPSNISIVGEGRNTKLKANNQNYVFQTMGSFSTDHKELNANANIGDTRLQVANTTGINVGDTINLISQRVATSDDAGNRSRLGDSTADSHNVRFAETFKVKAKGANYVDLGGSLVFTAYRTNGTQETHPNAGKSSFIRKANYVENVEFRNFQIVGDVNIAINIHNGKDCLVENVLWRDSHQATLVRFLDSYNCKAINCSHILRQNDFSSSSRISFISVSSVMCGFDSCYIENTRTPFDVTYNTSSGLAMPSMWCFVHNCRTKNTYRGITTHGGTYGTQITNNEFLGCELTGIETRSRETVISGNRIVGAFRESVQHRGINLYDGYAQDCIVSDNHIKGFSRGINILDGSETPFEHVGAIISNNTIINVNRGISMSRPFNAVVNVDSNILIDGNRMSAFFGSYGRAIQIDGHYKGVHIKNNLMTGNSATNAGIYTAKNVYEITLTGNVLQNFGGSSLWFAGVTDTETHGTSTKFNVIGEDNFIEPEPRVDRIYVENLSPRITRIYSSLRPVQDDSAWLGTSENRYRILYTSRQPIVSSDKKDKFDIKDETLGLSFIEKLKPVTYKRHDSEKDMLTEKTEHGLIAQDVEKALDEMKVENSGMIFKDNDNYGLSYQELIPALIKSIQELNAKMK